MREGAEVHVIPHCEIVTRIGVGLKNSGDAAAGTRKVGYITAFDRVVIDGPDDNPDAARGTNHCLQRNFGAISNNQIDLRSHQFGRYHKWSATISHLAVFDDKILALDEPLLSKCN